MGNAEYMGHFIEKPSQVNSSMNMFIVLALAAVAFAEPEAEADPAFFYSSGLPYTSLTRGFYNPVVYSKPVVYQKPAVAAVAPVAATAVYTKPAVYTYQKPVVYQKPIVYQKPVVTHAAPAVAAPTQVVTNYKSPVHYTAQSTLLGQSLGLPKYIAKNGPVEHVVNKREAEAEAEPEAEADPQFFYSTGVLPTTYHTGVVPAVPAVKTIAAPVSSSHAAVTPVVKSVPVAAPLVKSVVAPVVAKSPLLTYSTVHTPAVYSHAGVYNAIGQSNVAITPFGATHPSNVGLCLNYLNQQVPC